MYSIETIIFDIDGVLIPGDKWHREAFIRTMLNFDIEISEMFYNERLGSLPTRLKLEIIAGSHKFDMRLSEKANRLKQQFTREILKKRLKKSIRLINLFRKLKKDGYRIVCCSNSVRRTVKKVLTTLGLMSKIEFYLCAEDYRPKPNPEMYNKAIKILNLEPSQVLILEDSNEGIRAAKESGAKLLIIKKLSDTNYRNIIDEINKYQ